MTMTRFPECSKDRVKDDVCLMFVSRVDNDVVRLLGHLVSYCLKFCQINGKDVYVIVDEKLKKNIFFNYSGVIKSAVGNEDRIKFWSVDDTEWCNDYPKPNYVITLGGDGTILYATRLFKNYEIPPVISFDMGSLGFLAVFSKDKIKVVLDEILNGKSQLYSTDTRNRIQAQIHRHKPVYTKENSCCKNDCSSKDVSLNEKKKDEVYKLCSCSEQNPSGSENSEKFKDEYDTSETHVVLNDVTVDRGNSTISLKMLLYIDNEQVTAVQADGVIVSTPTGSTAYSLSSGGSLVHPDSQVILITPICTHTLSFRPLIIPDTKTVKIEIPENTRMPMYVCFDGRSRIILNGGDYVTIFKSNSIVNFMYKEGEKGSWFSSLKNRLYWNTRLVQNISSPVDFYDSIIKTLTNS